MAKLICWGPDRDTAIRRTLRALGETDIRGVKTTIPAAVAILSHPDFAAGEHSTKWVEERLDLSGTAAAPAPSAEPAAEGDGEAEPLVERSVTVEVNGKRFGVKMWVPESDAAPTGGGGGGRAKPRAARRAGGGGGGAAGSGQVTVPMQGTIVKVLVEVGQKVEVNQAVVVLEAMKMENQINADRAGTVTEIKVEPGQTVGGGDVVVVIGD